MDVERHKVVVVGARQSGKTTLVRRFVGNGFRNPHDDVCRVAVHSRYFAVPISFPCGARNVPLSGGTSLMFWDCLGECEESYSEGFLTGASAYMLVIDPSDGHSADAALDMHQRILALAHEPVCMAVMSKADIQTSSPDFSLSATLTLRDRGVLLCSVCAETGEGVDGALNKLVALILSRPMHIDLPDVATGNRLGLGSSQCDVVEMKHRKYGT